MTLWLPVLATPLHAETQAILFYGQSNAGAGGRDQPLLTAPVAPGRVFSFRTSRQLYGNIRVDPARLQGLGPLQDVPAYAPFPATAMAYALARTTPVSQDYFLHTVWYGGQPLTAFLPGTSSWQDLTAVSARIPSILAEKGKPGRIACLVLIHGESGPAGREAYARMLDRLLDDALDALRASARQSRRPVAMLLQTNASNAQAASANGAELAQWDIARARPADAVLAGPMYQFPLADTVHQSAIGRMMLGDLLALVYRSRILDGRPFQPLQPVSWRRDGARIVVDFVRPEGAGPIAWDLAWMPPTPNRGFEFRDDAASARIAKVEISGPAQVTILLDSPPSGANPRLLYAMGQPRLAGWAPGRGQLYAPTQVPSAFAGRGLAIPRTVSHYAIRFELSVP